MKYAYLQMNASGILERLGAVCEKIKDLRTALKEAHSDVVDAWTLPTDIPPQEEDVADDPNRMCHPQVFDFDVDVPLQ